MARPASQGSSSRAGGTRVDFDSLFGGLGGDTGAGYAASGFGTGSARGRITMRRKDGSRFEANLSSSVYYGPSGEARTSIIQLQELREFVPALHGDAAVTRYLQEAGLQHSCCAGVVALTDDNEVNLKVAITAKLLNPQIKVISRADSHDIEANMASFGTDHIVDPFDTFAAHLAVAFQAPCLYLLQRWLTGREGAILSEPVYPPRDGHWIVCGYGRFGRAICRRLKGEGVEVVVIEARPQVTGQPDTKLVTGVCTEAETLLEADIENAAGLVAGTDNDANNLSIVMTARELNSTVFAVVRQNQADNHDIIAAVDADMVMHPSAIIADKIRVLLATPMLYEFISLALYQDESWACELASRVIALVGDEVPETREWSLDQGQASALQDYLTQGSQFSVADLLRDPWQRERELNAIVLLIRRRNDRMLLPDLQDALKAGDRLLICGDRAAFTRMQWTVSHRRPAELAVASSGAAPARLAGLAQASVAALPDPRIAVLTATQAGIASFTILTEARREWSGKRRIARYPTHHRCRRLQTPRGRSE